MSMLRFAPYRQPKFMIFGALAPPRPEDPHLSSKALAALPPSPSVILYIIIFIISPRNNERA
jgi:hypothetical protein